MQRLDMIDVHFRAVLLRGRPAGGATTGPHELPIAGLLPFFGMVERPYLFLGRVCSRPAVFDPLYGLLSDAIEKLCDHPSA